MRDTTLRGESGVWSALVFMCQNRHISDALLNIKSTGGCMPYLRFAAAVPRIKHTNARTARSNGERMLHTDTYELAESLRLPLLISRKRQLIYYVRKYFITSSNILFFFNKEIFILHTCDANLNISIVNLCSSTRFL